MLRVETAVAENRIKSYDPRIRKPLTPRLREDKLSHWMNDSSSRWNDNLPTNPKNVAFSIDFEIKNSDLDSRDL